MKNLRKKQLLTLAIMVLFSATSYICAQTDTIATVDVQYTYDASETGGSNYVLVQKPAASMSIDNGTGIITWTPTSVDEGGRVKVTYTGGAGQKEFHVYVSNPFECPGDANAVSYWTLDESGGTYNDSKGTHDGTEIGSVGSIAGQVDNCASFTRTAGNGISVTDHADFHSSDGESFSVSLWFKVPTKDFSGGVPPVMFGRDEGMAGKHWWIGFQDISYSDIYFYVRDASGDTMTYIKGANYNIDTWHHLVCMYDADDDEMRMYLDGSNAEGTNDDRTVPFDADPNDNFDAGVSANLSIGFLQDPTPSYNFPHEGEIDEVLYYDKALSQAEITTLFNRGDANNPACQLGNFAPIFRGTPDAEATQGEAYSYTVEVSDMEGDALTLSSVILPSWLSFNTGTGELSGNPTNANVGDTIVRLQVTDAPGDDGYLQFNLTVKNINDDPTIVTIVDQTLDEEADFSLQVNADDIDPGDNLDYSISGAAWLSISATGLITGTPATDDTSSYTVTVTVTDDSSATADDIFELDILNINDAPAVTQDSIFNVQEEASREITLSELTVTDVDNAPGDISLTVQDGSNYSHVGNTITPADDFTGALTVPVIVQDLDSTVNVDISVNVNNINDAPVISSYPDAQAYEDQAYSYVFNANDADPGDVLILDYSVPKYPDWLSYNAGTRLLDGTPDINDVGQDTITLSVTDGTATTDTMIIITVNTSNTVPVITSTPVTAVDEDASYIYNITTFDGDGDGMILTAPVKPDWLTLNEAQGTLTGIPTNDQVGYSADSVFTVQLMVSDTKQDSTQTFTITVTNINDQPVITGQVADVSVDEEGSVTIELDDLVVEDVDNKPADLSVTVLPGDDYSIAGNTATFNAGVTGLTAVSVRVSDGDLNSGEFDYMVGVGLSAIKTVEQNGNLIKAVYPNPANHFVMMELVSTGILNFEIIDITGVRVFEEIIPANYREFSVDVSELHEGIYFYKVYNNTEQQTGSFMIIK